MEIKNKLTPVRGEGGEDNRERRGTCTEDPWTRTMERGLSLGTQVGQGRGDQWGKMGTTVTAQQ